MLSPFTWKINDCGHAFKWLSPPQGHQPLQGEHLLEVEIKWTIHGMICKILDSQHGFKFQLCILFNAQPKDSFNCKIGFFFS